MSKDLKYLVDEAKELGTDIKFEDGYAYVFSDYTTFDYQIPFDGETADDFINDFKRYTSLGKTREDFMKLSKDAFNGTDDDPDEMCQIFLQETNELIGALQEIRDEAQALLSQGLLEKGR